MSKPKSEKQATVLFCLNCGEPSTTFKSWLKGNSANLTCKGCGAKIVVKHALVGNMMASEQELEAVGKEASRPPAEYKTTEKQRESAEKSRPTAEKGWFNIYARVTGLQRDIINKAMKHFKQRMGIKGRVWKGSVLEAWAAEELAGPDYVPKSIPDDVFTEARIKEFSGLDLIRIAVFVFQQSIGKMFQSEDDLRSWILANAPHEYLDEKGMKEARECAEAKVAAMVNGEDAEDETEDSSKGD